ncbi:MAG: DUF3857 domain-containing transglutaminase family protein [Flavobacteriaceae bacterium]|nr:DUF3857 domain-containing transglutaminase family protein [Flavobacteriaceae bacterium]
MYVFLLSFCFKASLLFAQNGLYNAYIIDSGIKEKSNSVIRNQSTEVVINSKTNMQISYQQITTVLNDAGDKDVLPAVFYDDGIQVRKLEVLVYDASGKPIKKYKKSDFIDQSVADGFSLFNDTRALYVRHIPIEYPYTLEFNYELQFKSTGFIIPWKPLHNHYQSIEKSTYSITDKSDGGLRYKSLNLQDFEIAEPKKTEMGYFLEATRLKAVPAEQFSPSMETYLPFVRFALDEFSLEGVPGKAQNWNDFGVWKRDYLLSNRDIVSEETRQTILKLIDGIEDPAEKAKKIYHYLQDNTRYVSVQIGIGGWQPIDAATVDRVKYGDCKALTNYTKALLNVAGVKADYVIINNDSEVKNITPDFTAFQGNHAILTIPREGKDDIWLECTNQTYPFGYIGRGNANRLALAIGNNGGEIRKTPEYDVDFNRQITNGTVILDANGNITADVQIQSYGVQFEDKYRLAYESKEDCVKYYKKGRFKHFKDISFEKIAYQREDENIRFQEELNFKARTFGKKMGNRILLEPNLFSRYLSILPKYEQRIAPLSISYAYTDEDEVEIQIPEGYTIESIPQPTTITSKFGNYFSTIEVSENQQLVYKRSFTRRAGIFSKEAYDEYRAFIEAVVKSDNSKIILIKT